MAAVAKRARVDDGPSSARDTVKFNVGGRVFEVLHEPTLSLHPGSLLHTLAEDADGGSDEPIFVEADPDLFPYVLQYHRDRKIFIPIGVSKEAVLREARKMCLDVAPECILREGGLGVALGVTAKLLDDEKKRVKGLITESRNQFVAHTVIQVALGRMSTARTFSVTVEDLKLGTVWAEVTFSQVMKRVQAWAETQTFKVTWNGRFDFKALGA